MNPQEIQAAMQAAQREHDEAMKAAHDTLQVAQRKFQEDLQKADEIFREKMKQIQIGGGGPSGPTVSPSPAAPTGATGQTV
jgi:hypothetical protein